MFKYTPRKDILTRLAKAKKRPYPAYNTVLSEITQEFGYGDKHEQYNVYIAFDNQYQTMDAFYSKDRLKRFVPCNGTLLPIRAFNEEEINA